MQPVFVYSGTFDPPTFGHYALLMEAARFLPEIFIVCSDYSIKNPKFSLEERVALWKNYNLPSGVIVETINDFIARQIPGEEIVLIRGLRGEHDGEHEAHVLLESARNAGITKTLTFIASPDTAHISSSKVWEIAQKHDKDALSSLVTQEVADAVLKYPKNKALK